MKIAVIGLGYVGLPLAAAFSEKYEVTGFDVNAARIEELKSGYDRTLELSAEQMKKAIENGMKFSLNLDDIKDCNFFIVTVPTPIDKNKRPDLTPVVKATQSVAKVLKKGDIVVYESTVYPGVTEEICVPLLEQSGLKFNEDFFCGYSPERINPGDKEHTVTKIKKITSGSTPEVADKVDEVYRSIITAGTHKAPTIKVAEAAKVIENTQRDINIAFMNELAMIFNKMNIDTNAVLQAAGTKWNFLNFRPGLVGGHCIGVDPYYLTHKAQELGFHPEMILAGRRINDNMGKYAADQVVKLMIKRGVLINSARVLVLGLTFKENCPDTRNTKVIDIYRTLENFTAHIVIYDPWADPNRADEEYAVKVETNRENLPKNNDVVVLCVAHNEFLQMNIADYLNEKGIIYDVKGKLPIAENIFRL